MPSSLKHVVCGHLGHPQRVDVRLLGMVVGYCDDVKTFLMELTENVVLRIDEGNEGFFQEWVTILDSQM